jgi:hypothetical protein
MGPLHLAVLLSVAVLLAPLARADVELAVRPAQIAVEPGQVFDVELTVTSPGSAFNGYDAVVGYDPVALTFIEQSRAIQEGPLMTEACPQTFHSFEAFPTTGTLNLSHVLLCAGVSVSGPGVVYRLRFQANDGNTVTAISLLPATAFYQAGIYVTPVFTEDAEVRIGPVSDVPGASGPAASLHGAAPNPFNPRTTIAFEIPTRQEVTLRIFDLDGRLVRCLIGRETRASGRHEIVWNGRDESGRRVASGTYLYRLDTNGYWETRRMVLVK